MLSFFFTESMKKPLGQGCHVINLLHNMKRGSLQGRQGEHRQADNGEKGGGTRQGQRVGSKKKKKKSHQWCSCIGWLREACLARLSL